MMGYQDGQIEMVMMDLGELIPNDHVLKRIERYVSFVFVYELMAPYYSKRGRPSIDPVCMIKMMLVGYLYGIKSERRLAEEIQLNIAYRWFCGFKLTEKIPDHSLFSQHRKRKWKDSRIFEDIFYEIVRQCIESGLVDGEEMASDGSFVPSNVSRNSWIDVKEVVMKSMHSYLDTLDEELASQPGFKQPPKREVVETRTTSKTDWDCGYINHSSKRGVGYLLQATVDCKYGIITGVDVQPANEKESLHVLRHLEKQQRKTGLRIRRLALDRGYDTGAVHRGLELLGIEGHIPTIRFPNTPQKLGFQYDDQDDCFICSKGQKLYYHRLNCNKSTGKYLRCYQTEIESCSMCSARSSCLDKTSKRRRILASSCYPAFHRGHLRADTNFHKHMMKLRKIWIEGSFSVMKREHLIGKIRKRGIPKAYEECLLSALALNLKRIAIKKRQLIVNHNKDRLGYKYQDQNLVFCHPNGRPIDPAKLSERFRKWQLQKGVDYSETVDFHSIRISNSSLKLVLSGGDIKSVQKTLGDKTADMVLKTYARSLDKQYKSMNRRFDEFFYQNQVEVPISTGHKTIYNLILDHLSKPEFLETFCKVMNSDRSIGILEEYLNREEKQGKYNIYIDRTSNSLAL